MALVPGSPGVPSNRAAIQQALGVPLVFLGVGLPDDQIHAPNEKVSLLMLYRGAEATALLWENFARVGRTALAQDAIE